MKNGGIYWLGWCLLAEPRFPRAQFSVSERVLIAWFALQAQACPMICAGKADRGRTSDGVTQEVQEDEEEEEDRDAEATHQRRMHDGLSQRASQLHALTTQQRTQLGWQPVR